MPSGLPVLFLDVDGVLNRCAFPGDGLMAEHVELLHSIVRSVPVQIVVSSMWRRYEDSRRELTTMLKGLGAILGGWTPVLDRRSEDGISAYITRGEEIQAWLEANPLVSHFVILDDNADMGTLLPHLVQTDSSRGLTESIAQEVMRRLMETPGSFPSLQD